jgi:hypothetical protein
MMTPMPNYYYDAPPDFMPDETVTFEAEMEQPEDGWVFKEIKNDWVTFVVLCPDGVIGSTSYNLSYPLGARVGVREAWKGETCKHCGRNFRMVWSIPDAMWTKLPRKYQNKCLCLECAIWLINDLRWEDVTATGIAREECHWYTVTAVDVVKRDGQWVEKVTMRSEK